MPRKFAACRKRSSSRSVTPTSSTDPEPVHGPAFQLVVRQVERGTVEERVEGERKIGREVPPETLEPFPGRESRASASNADLQDET